MTNKVIVALDNKNLKQIIAIVKKKSKCLALKLVRNFFTVMELRVIKKFLNSL